MSEEEKIERLLNSIAKGCDGSIADEVKAIIIKQQKEIEYLKGYTKVIGRVGGMTSE